MAQYEIPVPGRADTIDVRVFGRLSTVPIPYAFTIGAVNFAGVFYLDTSAVEESFTDGAFIGAVVGTYHIDKDDAEACADNNLLKACIKIDFGAKKLFGRLCTRRITGGWDCGGWREILSW
jgi:hypothetical protein